jgi:hypothetical protein
MSTRWIHLTPKTATKALASVFVRRPSPLDGRRRPGADTRTQRTRAGIAIAGGVLLVLSLGSQTVSARPTPPMLEFSSMVGVPAALTGTSASAAFRGVNGGGLPWTLTSANGELTKTGHLEVTVTGLVFAAGPNVGANTVASFRGLVSCIDSSGSVHNVSTAPFPATVGLASAGGGNATIEADLSLPSPCLAPIVFVASPGGAWFAVTGG